MSKKPVRYEYLPWDSSFFGYRIGKIIIDDFKEEFLISAIRRSDADILYIFDSASSENVNDFLISEGAVKYDCRMDYKKLLSSDCEYVTDRDIRFYDGILTTELEYLAYSSGKYSRFRKDEKLRPFFKKLYKRWFLNSLEQEKRLLIAEKDEMIIGFLSFSVKEKTANINLFSVDRKWTGQGTGTRLYKVLEYFLVKSGITEVTVRTQMENTGACRFYEKLGFELTGRQNIYHLWK